MIGLERMTCSPASSSMSRSTPCVEGCWGPMLMIIVSSFSSARCSPCWAASTSDMRRTARPLRSRAP